MEDFKRFIFTVEVSGIGTTPENAWENAEEACVTDGLGSMPEKEQIKIEEI